MQHEPKSLGKRVFAAGSVTLGGYAGGQLLRLVSNLVLTRLLFPEAFGTMAILQAVLMGVVMLTDLGLSMSVMRSRRGDDPAFLNTIWTLQILKGLLVAFVLLVLAHPIALFYGNSGLMPMLAVIGLIAALGSFKSTKIDYALRHMQAKRVVGIELLSQVLQFGLTVVLALSMRSPWALLLGNMGYSVVYAVFSHLLLAGPANRLAWNSTAVKEIWGFSGWVMFNSTLTYLSGEGLNLLRAKLVDLAFMGQFNIATALTMMPWIAIQRLSGQVLFPAYTETLRNNPEMFPQRVRKSRRFQLIFCWFVGAFLVFFGEWIIGFMYDDRYAQAGQIMQISAVALVLTILSASYAGILEAMGQPRLGTVVQIIEAVFRSAGLVVGGVFWGAWGVVVASAVSAALIYPFVAMIYKSRGLSDALFDCLGFGLAAVLGAVVYFY